MCFAFDARPPDLPAELAERFAQAGHHAIAMIVIYPGAPHSFFDRRFEEHAEACADAWRRVLAFL